MLRLRGISVSSLKAHEAYSNDVQTLQTVAQLLARAMNELGFRTNDTMIETSAQEILKGDASDFADQMEQATGGCLFIDEAYRFTPSPPGQQPNLSNQGLDYLLEAVEKRTAGYPPPSTWQRAGFSHFARARGAGVLAAGKKIAWNQTRRLAIGKGRR